MVTLQVLQQGWWPHQGVVQGAETAWAEGENGSREERAGEEVSRLQLTLEQAGGRDSVLLREEVEKQCHKKKMIKLIIFLFPFFLSPPPPPFLPFISGGVHRDWVGYPRRYFAPGSKSWRCSCVREEDLDNPHVKLYPDCDPTSIRCKVDPNKLKQLRE